MSPMAERNQAIARRYLSGERTAALAAEYGVCIERIHQITRRYAPTEERKAMARANVLSCGNLRRAREVVMQRQRENVRNRQIEAWLDQGLTYTETAYRASKMFWETSRCAVAGIASRQRKREAA